MMRVVVRITVVVVASMVWAGCGGGSSPSDPEDGSAASDALATLEVISTDVTVQGSGDSQPSSSRSGAALDVGDTVRTDPSGFAEIGFFDGSLTRVENAATFTLTDLQDTEAAAVVDTSLQTGRSWNRIQDLAESETWTQDTPVAQATVRGTAYAVDCSPDPQTCVFTVVEGTVELRLPDGSTILLTARQRVVLSQDQPPGRPEVLTDEQLAGDEWIARNRGLDQDPAEGSSPSSEAADRPSLDDILGSGPGACTATVEITGALSVSASEVPTELSAESLFLTTNGVEVSASNRDGRDFVQISTNDPPLDVWGGTGLTIASDQSTASVKGTYAADGASAPITADIAVTC